MPDEIETVSVRGPKTVPLTQKVAAPDRGTISAAATAAENVAAIEATGRIVSAWIEKHACRPAPEQVDQYIRQFKEALLS